MVDEHTDAPHSAESGGVCDCGHTAFMHGDVVGDTRCSDTRCPCQSLRAGSETCRCCGTSWTADVAECPMCAGSAADNVGAGEQQPQGTRDEAVTETSEQPQAIRADAHNAGQDAPDLWISDPLPGGFVCSVCQMPVESEPCAEHQPEAHRG